jgi:hypothetical protein
MNFGSGPGMQLPRGFGDQGMNNGLGRNNFNNGFNNQPRQTNNYSNGYNSGMNYGVANKVEPVKPVDRTFKSIDGTVFGSFEEAVQHNKKYYYEQGKFKNNHFN